MSNAGIGYGSLVEVGSSGVSPDIFQTMEEVKTITPPSNTLDQIDVTHMQSPNRRREFVSGLNDGGEFAFEMNFVPGSPTDDLLFDLLNLPAGQSRRRNLKITFGLTGTTWQFGGELTGYEITCPFDDVMLATATFKVSGDLIRGTT